MKAFFDTLTPVLVVQALLSIIVVAAFVFQEVTIHTVDTDLKIMTVGVVTFWLGGLTVRTENRISNRSSENG